MVEQPFGEAFYPSYDSSYGEELFDPPALMSEEPMASESHPAAIVTKAAPANTAKASVPARKASRRRPVAEVTEDHSALKSPVSNTSVKKTKAKPVSASQPCEAPSPTPAAFVSQATAAGPDPACTDCKHVLCPPHPPIDLYCDCDPNQAVDQCPLYRFLDYALAQKFIADHHLNPNCLVCVKEPFICNGKQVTEEVEIVLYRCKKTATENCTNGKCITESVSELEPCTTKFTLCHVKQYVKYCEVWIYIDCHLKVPAGTPTIYGCP